MWELVASGVQSTNSLSLNCAKNLRVVLDIDRSYRELLLVNSCSSEFRDLMELYSRFVMFDVQLASEIGK